MSNHWQVSQQPAHTPTSPVILLSAVARYNDPRDRVEGLLAGASAFLTKPITIEDLWAEICGVLKRPATEFA